MRREHLMGLSMTVKLSWGLGNLLDLGTLLEHTVVPRSLLEHSVATMCPKPFLE
jgi:hypothetical protein